MAKARTGSLNVLCLNAKKESKAMMTAPDPTPMPMYVYRSVLDIIPAEMVAITVACGVSRGASLNVCAVFKSSGTSMTTIYVMITPKTCMSSLSV